MATTINLPENEMTSFDLPRVCVVTGATENVVFKPVKFQWYPRWVAVFACAPLIMVIVMLALMKRAKGELPFTEQAWAEWKRGQLLIGLSVVAAIVLFVAGMAAVDSYPVVTLLGVLLAIAVPIGVGVKFLRGKGVACTRIADGRIELKIPSAEAAQQISTHLSSGTARPAPAAGFKLS